MGKRSSGLAGLARFVQELKGDSGSSESPKTNDSAQEPPTKKRKTTSNSGSAAVEWKDPWVEKYDATGLVPHYTNASEVPEHLQKYFSQRTRFLSLYSTPPGCLLDEEGWYSITPELIANQIAERCRCDTILDAFCGVGGNAIAFAKTCQRVIALDTSPIRLALARHNAQIYGVADRIEFILTDYISFAKSYISLPKSASRKIDVVFLSPPWGGPSYLSGIEPTTPTPVHHEYTLDSIQPIPGADLFNLSRRITPNIAYYLPRNTKLEEVGALVGAEKLVGAQEEASGGTKREAEQIEVEEEWMGTKLKAITCYFGGLVAGQGDLF